MLFPAVTGSGVSVLVTARSADGGGGGVTVVVAVPELLAGSGSAVVELAVAVFVTTASRKPGSTCTTSVTVADAPLAIEPSAHETVAVPAQAPCDGVAETNVVPGGRVS